jgi:dTDP-glucose 4,6-dehydratase
VSALLITGAAGFIGSNFTAYWRRARPGDALVLLDALTYAGNLANLEDISDQPCVSFVKGDICDEALVQDLLTRHRIDTIVHFAAESHVDRSIVAPDAFVRTNVNGTLALLQAATRTWKGEADRRLHHVSTDEVYGSLAPGEAPFTESSPYNPRSPYAASKAASDMLVRACAHTYGLLATISNTSNNYGPRQFPEKLVPLMITNALLGRRLPVYGDGLHARDWVHVEDHCAALFRLLTEGRPGETYNIGGGAERSNIDIVNDICDCIDRRFAASPDLVERFPDCPAGNGTRCRELVVYIKDRPGHDRRYAIDDSKLQRELGRMFRRPLSLGLSQTVDWYVAREDWWRPIQSGEHRLWLASHYGETMTRQPLSQRTGPHRASGTVPATAAEPVPTS